MLNRADETPHDIPHDTSWNVHIMMAFECGKEKDAGWEITKRVPKGTGYKLWSKEGAKLPVYGL